MDWDEYEEAFKKLDNRKFDFLAKPLAEYLSALVEAGFTREEAFKLVEAHSKWLYDMAIEEFISATKVDSFEIDDYDMPDDPDEDDDIDTPT